jgi:hypothetical protein
MPCRDACFTTAVATNHGMSTWLRTVYTVRILVTLDGYGVPALDAGLLHLHSAQSAVLPAALQAFVCTAWGARLQTILDAVDDIVRDRMAKHLASVAALQLRVARQSAAAIRTFGEIIRALRLHHEVSVLAALQREMVQQSASRPRDIADTLPQWAGSCSDRCEVLTCKIRSSSGD